MQQIILKGRKPIEGRPGAALPPADFEKVRASLAEMGAPTSDEAVSSYCLYPKVFSDWAVRHAEFGDVSVLPTFFFGMKTGEEIKVEIEQGKMLVIKLLQIGEANEDGIRTIFFEFNGLPREIDIKDRNVKSTNLTRKKADKTNPGEIGATLSGSVVKLLVEKGQAVEKGTGCRKRHPAYRNRSNEDGNHHRRTYQRHCIANPCSGRQPYRKRRLPDGN